MSSLTLPIFLWIVDNSIALLLFGNRVKTEIPLPNEIQQVTPESYRQVKQRIIAFKTSLLFDRRTELILSEYDINALLWKNYDRFLKEANRGKAFNTIKHYKIQDNELIEIESNCFLCFRHQPLSVKVGLKFSIEKGKLIEMQRYLEAYHRKINSNYFKNDSKFRSSLIDYIFSVSNQTNSRKTNKIEVTKTLQKIKSIVIRDNQLILSS